MNPLLVAALFAVAPAAPHASRGAHDGRHYEADWALHEPPPPATVIVWDDANIRFPDDEPVARPPAPMDPVGYLPGTRIRVRTGFTARTLHAAGDVRR